MNTVVNSGQDLDGNISTAPLVHKSRMTLQCKICMPSNNKGVSMKRNSTHKHHRAFAKHITICVFIICKNQS
jgi:hypothetical protein